MTQLKDVIHLYLGCECAVGYSGQENIGLLIDIIWGVDKNGVTTSNGYEKFSEIKPILRQLSDMTIEEAEHFAWLCMDSEYHLDKETRITKDEIDYELVLNDGGTMLDNDVEIYIGVSARCFEGAVMIKKDGSISVIDDNGDVQYPIDNVAHKVLYLLKQGFDLFGLHESGQCLYKTDIK